MSKPPRTKPSREELRPDQSLCDFCTAKCCKYFALPIDAPESLDDWQTVRWFLLHDRATVFREDETWYLLVHTTCKHLRADNLCGIYLTRPNICREYSTTNCEYEDDWVYDGYFELPEQVEEYCEAIYAEPTDPNFRTSKPSLLPIIS